MDRGPGDEPLLLPFPLDRISRPPAEAGEADASEDGPVLLPFVRPDPPDRSAA